MRAAVDFLSGEFSNAGGIVMISLIFRCNPRSPIEVTSVALVPSLSVFASSNIRPVDKWYGTSAVAIL